MNSHALLPLSGFVANLLLAALVLARNPRGAANRLYALLGVAIAWWSVLKFSWRLVGDAESALALYRVSAFGWCMLPSVYLHFVLAFTAEDGRSRRGGFVGLLHGAGAAFAIAAFAPGAMVRRMVPTPWGFSHEPGPIYRVFTAYLVLTFVASIVLLVRARARARKEIVRTQCSYLIVGILFPLVGGVVTNMLGPLLGIHRGVELAEVLSTVNVAVIAWAMSRHKLLGLSLEDAAETIIATMGDALLVVNRTGEIVLSNAATAKMLGVGPGSVTGKPVASVVRSKLFTGEAQISLDRSLRIEEAEFLPPGGDPVPVMLSASPVREADGNLIGLVCVAKDIRELRKVMVDLASANARLEQLAVTDELTGVSNRRYSDQRLAEEFGRSWRYGRTFSVAVLDLDDFKRINDTHGHQAGDRVLQVVAGVLRTTVRATDVVARWGGDEFMMILHESDAPSAAAVGERIVSGIAAVVVPGVDLPVRASLGVATFDPASPPTDPTLLLKSADEALYRAKHEGKGRLVAAPASSP